MLAGMTRLLPVVSAVFLFSLGAHAQVPAVRPVPRPPAYTPGYSPGTPPDPVYTPPGTGLPEVGQPGTHAAPVKRSPNKRALPASSEPGLWAADGAPKASASDAQIFGVSIPLPAVHGADAVGAMCSHAVTKAMRDARMTEVLSFPEAVRACMAAQALYRCVLKHSIAQPQRPRPGPPPAWDPRYVKTTLVPHAERVAKERCADVKMTEEQGTAFRSVLEQYLWAPTDLSFE
jgi:hypothetical protein